MRKREEAMRNTNGKSHACKPSIHAQLAAIRWISPPSVGWATSESTNARVLWFSVFSVCVLLSTAAWQVRPCQWVRGIVAFFVRCTVFARMYRYRADVPPEAILQEEETDLRSLAFVAVRVRVCKQPCQPSPYVFGNNATVHAHILHESNLFPHDPYTNFIIWPKERSRGHKVCMISVRETLDRAQNFKNLLKTC